MPLLKTCKSQKQVQKDSLKMASITQTDRLYAHERDKRIRADAATQYVDAEASDKFKRFAADCWAAGDGSLSTLQIEEGAHLRILVIGAGFGGLLFAVHLIKAGFSPSDLVIIDTAGGFGGTWYWNRYPGLMCDVESYIYLPLLEETNYMPKHKYAYGDEIREHANRIAKKWALSDRAVFRTQAKTLSWSDSRNVWNIDMNQHRADGSEKMLTVTSDFVIVASGALHSPQLTDFGGVNKFLGHSFHTARWDYDYTGGSQGDPSLVNLKDKKVGIVGTGASAIQVIPHLARWSKELYVFQRTPASVDVRGQHATDPEAWFKEICPTKGWQRDRTRNFIAHTVNTYPRPQQDLINDGWTHCPSFSGVVGAPRKVTAEATDDYIAEMQALDLPRSERIRARVDEVVKDKAVAKSLKPWYYAWCKRPTFHDDYLPTFNLPNVTLVDTNGKGIDDVREGGIVANGQLHDLDVIVYSTGFTFYVGASPTARSSIATYGRLGRSLEQKWHEDLDTLHGVVTRDFPNLFFHALSQGAGSVNFASALDTSARHVAFIIANSLGKIGSGNRITIEPTAAAEQEWSDFIVEGASFRAPAAGCTPSYYNAHGMMDKMSPKQKKTAAKAVRYPYGLNMFNDFMDEWHARGDLSELDIRSV